jgi:AraC-like DNA-binding protein
MDGAEIWRKAPICLPPTFSLFRSHLDQKEQDVNEILRQRIGERVSTLKISWRRASLEAGLEAGFIQDLITGRSAEPAEEALANLAAVLQCSPAYLTGRSDEVSGEARKDARAPRPVQGVVQRPDAVMALRIVDELLAEGHIDAARMAVKRALKEIQAEASKQPPGGAAIQSAVA